MIGGDFASYNSKPASACHSRVLLAYALFAAVALLIYHLIAEGEFSSVLTLSAVFQCLAFSLLALQVFSADNIQGISVKSLQLDAIAIACRLSSTTWLNGYVPNDQSGDYLYQVFDMLCFALVLWLLYRVSIVQEKADQRDADSLPAAPFAAGSFILALLFHADLNDRPFFDALWMCGLFTSTVAVLPQLWMMTRRGGSLPALTSHFVAVMAFSRALSGVYMWEAHEEITCQPWIGTFNHSGYAILAAHAVHLLLLSDFVYFYVKHLTKEGLDSPLTLPESMLV